MTAPEVKGERNFGKLVPPFPVLNCADVDCGALLTEASEAYLFTDLDSGKMVCFCGATAAMVELHHADRFRLVML